MHVLLVYAVVEVVQSLGTTQHIPALGHALPVALHVPPLQLRAGVPWMSPQSSWLAHVAGLHIDASET